MAGEVLPGVIAGCVDPDAFARNGKARSAVAAAPGHQEVERLHFPQTDAERKSLRNLRDLQARFALLGLALHRTDEGFLLVDSVGRARALREVEQAERLLEDLGGAR
ncbi:hypothetical protein [Roseateles sp.]|uniref:hypothetical protein n=1 Tax=Roseateles sp. TaxID=1971397 RepID=UPI0031E0E434